MSTYTITTDDESLKAKITAFLRELNSSKLDIYIDDDEEDSRLIQETSGEESMDLREFLANES